ncbi:DUF5683 domain-containing protein [Hymenobacter weizhouensis]|uniref:DUF5683 domain-containing protein n=1 Tax=Hymenobacter sp. YIM 151500-1 TaxID=2987689 RepID=UPI002225C674|nr:DUF5683 domain-containing protein [Hymenobacter sp. YIM 151500-1]UYZ63380.1 DUF5683 domain-containing protein [Hymenobacter sp. YIM 151500-1]
MKTSGVFYVALLSVLLAVLPLARFAHAQIVTTGPDSARVAPAQDARTDSLRRTERLLGFRVTRPQKAAILAAAVPGAGQLYNRRYWKLPLVYGALGGTGYGLYFYQIRYKEYVRGKQARENGQPDPGPRSSQETSVQNVQNGIVFYRRKRDTFIAYTALAYTLTILDALVDAHLRDFDVSEDLSLRIDPTLLPPAGGSVRPQAGVALTLQLK